MDYYGTLGPACAGEETLRAMFDEGMTGVRLNLSHGTLPQNGRWVESCRAAFARSEMAKVLSRPRLIIDLQGPELRIGALPEPVRLEEGGTVRLCGKDGCAHGDIPVPGILLETLKAGEQLSLDDSAFLLEAERRDGDGWRCVVLRGGVLTSRKSLAVLGREIGSPALTEEDLYNLDHAAEYGVTDLLQPFCPGCAGCAGCPGGAKRKRTFPHPDHRQDREHDRRGEALRNHPRSGRDLHRKRRPRECHAALAAAWGAAENRGGLQRSREAVHGRDPDAPLDAAQRCPDAG